MSHPQGIDYFNRGHLLSDLQAKVSLGARRRMFERFRRFAHDFSDRTVLDVGATPDVERLDSNCMIPWFHEAGLKVSVYSPEEISHLSKIFPFASVLPSAGFGKPIPCGDQQFDWVCSSAVIEHAGARSDQIRFLAECGRAAKGLFVTTPNRFHWLEFHTKLPLLHWLPRKTHRALLSAAGLKNWARESHLNLLSEGDFRQIAQDAIGNEFDFTIETVWTLGMPSNLILLAERR